MIDNIKLTETYNLIEEKNNEVTRQFLNFITQANELVELSEDDYQIEKTFQLNKISLKGFVLESSCCNALKDNNISNYSIQELNIYLSKYEETYNIDCSKYYLALTLYELIENIEMLIDTKINLELDYLTTLLPSINNLKYIDKSKYNEMYLVYKKQIEEIRLDNKYYDMSINILNDVFNYYINGYPDIPEYSE